MKFLFLMDPPSTVNIKKDTSFAFMESAHERGHEVYYLPKGNITSNQGSVVFRVYPTTPQRVPADPLPLGDEMILTGDEIDAVFIRPDPPFNVEYLNNTWFLDRLPARVVVLNKPSGIRTVNEKLWATQFTDIIPRTVVTRHKQDFLAFLEQEGEIIAKPTDGHGGTAVFHLHKGGSNLNVTFEVLTDNGRHEIILQQYLPEAKIGDKRVLILNGEYLGAVLRVHNEDDHRNNFFAGGSAQEALVTERDLELVATLSPHLKALGLYFVGIDVIGKYLVEVNVTSPTGIQEASNFAGERLADRVVEAVEQMVEQRRTPF
ncbi:MAG: glutathione synthase [Chloroflexota bacterium]